MARHTLATRSLLSIVRSASKAESVFGPQDEVERAVRMFVQGANSQPLSFFGRFAIKSTLQQMLKARYASCDAARVHAPCTQQRRILTFWPGVGERARPSARPVP